MTIPSVDILGGPATMNKAAAPHLIQDNHFEEMIDFLTDRIGFIRQRGPVKRAKNISGTDTATLTTGDPVGIVSVFNKFTGNTVFFVPSTATNGDVLISPYTSTTTGLTGFPTAASSAMLFAYPISFGPWKGVVFSLRGEYAITDTPFFWRGADKATYSTGTITVARGSTSVTGASTLWAANAVPGMILLAKNDDVTTDYAFVGWVKTVTDNTNIILEEKSLQAVTGRDYRLMSIDSCYTFERVSKGLITTSTSSTTVSGGKTKFRQQMSSGTWLLFRKRDLTFIGKVSSIADDDSLTLAANAAVAMSDEEYFAVTASTPGASRGFGMLTTSYASRQWWGSSVTATTIPDAGRRLYFSDINDPFALYVKDKEGDYVEIPIFGTHKENFLVAIQGTYAGMLIWDSYETNILTGLTEDTFQINNFFNDGCLNHQTIWEYKGGYLWAGRKGIYFFDGTNATNLVEHTLGDYYTRIFLDYDFNNERVWAMLHRDHYFLHYETNNLTFIINLENGSVTTATNLRLRGATKIPGNVGSGIWYVVDDGTKPVICDAENLFDESAVDTITCTGESTGPRIQLDSKQFDVGAPMVKKFWKALGMRYKATGADIDVYMKTGLDGSFTLVSGRDPAEFPVSATYTRKRIKFHKFDEHISFRLVGETPGSVTTFWASDLTLFFKPQRKERF